MAKQSVFEEDGFYDASSGLSEKKGGMRLLMGGVYIRVIGRSDLLIKMSLACLLK